MPHDAIRDLELLIRARHGLIWLDTPEEERANALLRYVASRLRVPFFTWTRSQGIRRGNAEDGIYDTSEPVKAFRHIGASPLEGVYHVQGLVGSLPQKDLLNAHIRDAAALMRDVRGAVVLTGTTDALPPVLREVTAHVTLPGPSDREFRQLLERIVRDLSARQDIRVTLRKEDVSVLVGHLSGLTLMEAEKILTKAIVEDATLGPDDIRHVVDAKRRIVERDGLLEYYPVETAMAEVADLATLKDWLRKRKAVVEAPDRARDFGLEFPKGMLLLGVPGCGKSLCAKAVANEWGLPLLKLDPSNLYNKFIGESESNFKRAMAAAERMAPVVLWIDELEKAFASGGGDDGGVSQRILGSFLSWMQDRRGDVFVVATANDIQSLPPEFLRKGRFEEIFFVDLPDSRTRAEVFRIHLTGRGKDVSGFDLASLARATDGFSGSEVEQVVVSGLYTAFAAGVEVDDSVLLSEVAATRPLSVTMAEKIDAMRSWAVGRAVRAN